MAQKESHLREFHLKLMRKRDEKKALIAVGRKLASSAYRTKRNVTYEELSPWRHS